MADRKISDLTALTAPASGDYLPIVDISEAAAANKNKRITIEELMRGAPDGTFGAPGFAFESDPNTGIYSPGADQLAISTNGTGRLFVDASGNVGVGASSPANGRLNVSSTTNQIALDTTDTATYGRLDIGHFTNGTFIGTYAGSNTASDLVRFGTGGTERLRITSTGTVNIVGAGTAGSTQAISFSGSAPVNSLVVDSSGRCGIGTSSPSHALTVNGAISSLTGVIRAEQGANAGFVIGSRSAQTDFQLYNTGNVLRFYNGSLDALSIDTSGRVGIGVTSPGYALHVVGTINSSDANIGFRTALTNGLFQAREFGGSSANNTLEFNIRPDSGKSGYLTFTESSVADRWSIGIQNGSDGLRFISGTPTTGTERCRIDGSGRLLVGTSTSRATHGSSLSSAFQVEGTTYNTSSISVIRNQGGFGAGITLAGTGGTTLGSVTAVSNNNGLGGISFQGSDGTNLIEAAGINAEVDGTPGANDMPGRLVFSTTADGASSPTEQLRISSTGEIGAGYYGSSTGYKVNIQKDGSCLLVLDTNSGDSGSRVLSTWRTGTYNTSDTTSQFLFFQRNDGTGVGSITRNGTNAVAYNTTSDYRLKENVVAVTDGIFRLQQLNPSRFNFIDDPSKTVDGFIAHEVQDVVPEAITGEKDAVDDDGNPIYQGIDQSKLVPLLTAALQEAIGEIESLKARVAALESA